MVEFCDLLTEVLEGEEIVFFDEFYFKRGFLLKLEHIFYMFFGYFILGAWRYHQIMFPSQEFIFIKYSDIKSLYIIHDLTQLFFPRNMWAYLIVSINLYVIRLSNASYQLVCPSIETAKLLNKRRLRAIVIPNPFDVDGLLSILDTKTANGGYFVWIGSKDKHKRYTLLEDIARMIPETLFLTLGYHDCKSPKNIQLAPTGLTNSEVYELIFNSKGVIITSKMEGFCRPAYEAWFLNKPIYIPSDINLSFPFDTRHYNPVSLSRDAFRNNKCNHTHQNKTDYERSSVVNMYRELL